MKKRVEEKVLKTVATVAHAGMKKQNSSTSICPVIFHQPKRPQKCK